MSTADHCEAPGLMPLATAVRLMSDAVEPLNHSETIDLRHAHKRVLVSDIIAGINVPPADNSAMDGYALNSADLAHSDTLLLAGTALAGAPFSEKLASGQCVRIMTGGLIPAGADSVVMQENTQLVGSAVQFLQQSAAGQNVRIAGSDIAQGQVIVSRGTLLSPAHLALIASVGQAKVTVSRSLKIGLIATGDELTPPGQPLSPGAIYESNHFALSAMLENLKHEVKHYGIIQDDPVRLREVFQLADSECDLVISCGGVSVGDADFVKQILSEVGQINFWQVAIKPGKPFAFGRLSRAWFCGLPGNPVSSYVTFEQLVMPLLRKLSGQQPIQNPAPYFIAQAADKIRKRPGRADFQRGRFYRDEQGQLWAKALGSQSSGVMSSLTQANCYLVLAQQQSDVEAGQAIQILPFSNLFTD